MTDTNAELVAQVAAQLMEAMKHTTTTYAKQDAGWARSKPTGIEGLQGLGIPVRLPRGQGCNVEVTLFFGPERAANEDAIHETLDALEDMRIPVREWKPSNKDNNRNERGARSDYGRRDYGRQDSNRDYGRSDSNRDYGRRDNRSSGYRSSYRRD